MKLRIAVAPGGGFDADRFGPFVDTAERLGFDTIWLSDVPMAETVDPVVGLTFAASRTERLKLGANLVPIGRNPMLLAKELAQLDQLSGGRLLLSLVPGLDQPGERSALGIGRANRGAYLDEVMPLLRRWWAGETVEYRSDRFEFPGVAVRPLPVQSPLELWLGGKGPAALARVGRLADGWLGAAVVPDEVPAAMAAIEKAAADAGRTIDPEHFGLSIPYAHARPDDRTIALLRARRNDSNDPPLEDLLPVGAAAVRGLLGRLAEHGLSKFVLRPVEPVASWDEELSWLAEAVLDLQT